MPFIFNVVAGKKKASGGVGQSSVGLVSVYCHSVAVDVNGQVWGWGPNGTRQLGNNSTTSRRTPVSVAGATKTFCHIAAIPALTITNGGATTAIDKNGQAWGWGYNNFGQLGDNSVTTRGTPVSVLGATKTFCKISSHDRGVIAIDKNGQAWGWGYNFYGQLGDNSTTSRLTPVSVLGATKTFCQIASGRYHSAVIDKNGQAWSWGYNNAGQLGDNTNISKRTPVSVLGATKTFCQIAAGGSNTAAIDYNGRVWSWGSNARGQLGNNSLSLRCTPVSVAGATKTFCKISVGNDYTVAIDKNGQAWGWGYNFYGQLGDNSVTSTLTPVSVLGATKTFCEIAAGQSHTLAIDKNGSVWAWGFNENGQLGNNPNHTFPTATPVSIVGVAKTFCQIAAGATWTVGLDKNGQSWGWGNNSFGNLGDNSTIPKCTPVSVLGATKTFCQIIARNNHTVAIDYTGQAWSWGLNNFGQLGNNSTVSERTPVAVVSRYPLFFDKVAAGSIHSGGIESFTGLIWMWGGNSDGQLGDNTVTSRIEPISVAGATKTFCQIAAGWSHTVAIDKNGQSWAWGRNTNGQLGDNSTTSRLTPVSVLGATKTFCQIAGGFGHTAAIDKNGQAWGWGNNFYGQLGDNSTISKCTPVSVLGATKTFCQISAGGSHTVAIDYTGQVWSWGRNTNGQLGDNSRANRCTPVSLRNPSGNKTFCHITAGAEFTIAIEYTGQVWAWGIYSNGQLGTGEAGYKMTPVRVCNL